MVLNLILAISIPLSLTIMGFFYYKTLLLFVSKEELKEVMPPFKEEEGSNVLTPDVLDEYLNGGSQ